MAYGAPAPFGVCHADDLYMLFDPLFVNWIPEEGLNDADSSVSDTMIELWKNVGFAHPMFGPFFMYNCTPNSKLFPSPLQVSTLSNSYVRV